MSTHPQHLHVLVEGQGPVLVLSHALGCDLGMWDEVAALLRSDYTVVRYDHRGHGASGGGDAPFTIDDLADDAADLIASLGRGSVHFAGVSMGGMTAMALAARRPELLRSVVVAHAASHYDANAQAGWQARIAVVRSQGMAAVADGALQRWFSPAFLQAQPARMAALRSTLLAVQPHAYAHACAAVAGIALSAGNAHIHCPALVIAGAQDLATPLACSQAIAAEIPHAQLAVIDAAHIGCVEQPVAFTQLLREHMQATF